ncbi:MAG TPA: hypothetical protein VHB21_26730, partial [Minicystis sp.]|nr:hypothetical protein [Minicystis sp.]
EDGAALLAPFSTWLLRTDGTPPGARWRARVEPPRGLAFVSGTFRARDGDGYEGLVSDLAQTPYGGFGPFEVRTVPVAGASIDVAITPGDTGVSRDRLVAWIAEEARAVAAYYGRFPVPRALVLVRAGDRGGVGEGATMGEGGASIMLDVGRDTTEAELADDWILVHEMVHVAFPSVLRPWAEEGLATYVEPIIRARAGLRDRDHVWRDLVLGLPKGQPGPGDRGLDRTPTWGRTYWGGAAFWLLADVETRRRTNGARSLDDALRAIVDAGGNVSVTWDLDRALRVGDRATGVPVLEELRGQMGPAPFHVDLDALFAKLGVSLRGRAVVYDDQAPLAWIRRAITGG